MTRRALTAAVVGATFVLLSHASAQAQSARTWVASTGSDANACTRAAPCKTFAGALAKTNAGGEVNCVDADDYGAMTITKSVSVVCDNTKAGISVATVGITVNTAASDSVTLKGIDIDGRGTGTAGINVIQGGAVHVHKVRIRNFRSTTARANGINFVPTAAAALYVTDTLITESGSGFGGSAIQVAPSAASTVAVTGTRLENNLSGMRIINVSPAALNVTVADSTVVGNQSGILNSSGNFPSHVMLARVVIANNGNVGVFSSGAAASTRIGDSVVSGHATGISNAGGAITSYKNNQIRFNTVDGTPLPAEPAE